MNLILLNQNCRCNNNIENGEVVARANISISNHKILKKLPRALTYP
jgi:hypothetical protein